MTSTQAKAGVGEAYPVSAGTRGPGSCWDRAVARRLKSRLRLSEELMDLCRDPTRATPKDVAHTV